MKLGLPLGSHQTQHISYIIRDEKGLGSFLETGQHMYMYMYVEAVLQLSFSKPLRLL